jgi:NADH dehydrogenase
MILITGGTGFIGSRVVRELLDSGEKIRCIVVRREGLPHHKNIEVVLGDITDRRSIDSAVKGCKMIIHLAAVLNNDDSTWKVNVEGTANIVDAAKRFGADKIVFVSTENVIPEKKDSYAASKSSAEKIVRQFGNSTILRLTAVYGRGCRGNMARLFRAIEKRSIVPVLGDGNNRIQPIYVGDAVDYILNSLRSRSGTYIVGGVDKVSMNEFIDAIAGSVGRRVFKFHLPLWLAYPFVKLCSLLMNVPPISSIQIYYARIDRTYDISKTIRFLKHRPLKLKDGLRLAITG